MHSLHVSKFSVAALVYLSQLAFGQSSNFKQPPSIIPPSPNAAALGKYGNIPVSIYTGVPDISIPLFELNARDIKIPISISYHASGIKVAEEASIVGLGWVLNCGGVITRTIMNKDDFIVDPAGYLSSPSATALPNGPQYVPASFVVNTSVLPFYNLTGGNSTTPETFDITAYKDYDYEPDLYSFNFLGYSGKFILDKERKPIFSKQEKLSINPLDNEGVMWEAMTPDGFRYLFEIAEDVKTEGGTLQKTAWYLTQVISPKKEIVTFHYDVYSTDRILSTGSFFEMREDAAVPLSSGNSCSGLAYSPGKSLTKEYSRVSLNSITWNNGSIELVMADRLDLYGDKRLAFIKLKNKDNSLKEEYAFNHDYFTSSLLGTEYGISSSQIGTNQKCKRLKLLSISKEIITANNKQRAVHSFSYYEGNSYTQLPAKNSYARDHWGYYNGRNNNNSLIPTFQAVASINDFGVMGPQRNPSSEYVAAFTLNSITYPTGGVTTFKYEINKNEIENYSPIQIAPSPIQVTDRRFYTGVKKGEVFSHPDLLDLRKETLNAVGQPLPIQMDVFFRITTDCKGRKFTMSPDAYIELLQIVNDQEVTVQRVSASSCSCSPDDRGYGYVDNNLTLVPGLYKWKAYFGPEAKSNATNEERLKDPNAALMDVSATYRWWTLTPPGPKPLHTEIAGGLRIASIRDFDPKTLTGSNLREYVYEYLLDTDADNEPEEHSYGKKMAPVSYSYYQLSTDTKDNNQTGGVSYARCNHLIRISDSNYPLFNNSGASVGYRKVIEHYGNREFGRVEYEYENESDIIKSYTISENGTNFQIKPPGISTIPNAKNGMLIRKRVFDNAGKLVHKIENTNSSKDELIKYGVEKRVMSSALAGSGDIFYLLYESLHASFTYVSKTEETTYAHLGYDSLKKTTSFSYDNPLHHQLTKQITEESNGTKTIAEFTYPSDYTLQESDVVNKDMMGAKFMHALPIETSISEEDAEGTIWLKRKEITKYDYFGSQIYPKLTYSLKARKPLAAAEMPSRYTPSSTVDLSFYKKNWTLDYNSGNIALIQKDADYPISYLWGYTNTFPIAEVKNAPVNSCFFTSFEEDGTIGLARTGTRYLAASSYTFPSVYSPLASATVMSYWYYSGNVWSFSGEIPYSTTISITGTAIDEVRAYPKGARMTSYTYDPLGGMTSAMDANGITVYYEYDSSNRLIAVKDNDGNVLKHYEYSYAIPKK